MISKRNQKKTNLLKGPINVKDSHIYIYMAVDQYSCFRKTPSSREKSFFRESFATPSPRPFVCSVRSGAIVAAAVVLANTVAAVHLRAARSSVKCRQSPSFALAACGCRDVRNRATGSLAFRRSFADLSRNLLQNSPANVIDLHQSQHRQGINNASVGAAYLPLYKAGLQEFNAESFAKKKVSFANSIADLSRRDLSQDEWSPNT